MNDRNLPEHQSIIHCLKTLYGINVATLTPLLLGADLNAAVFKAETRDKHVYFVKQKRGNQHDMSAVILEQLRAAGVTEIISPIKTVNGNATQQVDDFSLMVYPFIEGQDGFSQDLTDEQWVTLGQVLRQIHDLKIASTIQQQIRQESFSPKWRERVRSIYTSIETTQPPRDTHGLTLMLFMKENRSLILQLVKRAEELAQRLQYQDLERVLCHSDIHGGNVLIGKNHQLYIVDWDEPIMAPKERDLMFIGGGVANKWNKAHEEHYFYQGYGSTPINREILSYYRHERIVEDIAVYAQEILLSATPPANGQEMLMHFMNMFDPEGVVDIALKTDFVD